MTLSKKNIISVKNTEKQVDLKTVTKMNKAWILAAISFFISMSSFAGAGWYGIITNHSSGDVAIFKTSENCWYGNDLISTGTNIAPVSVQGFYTEANNSGGCNNYINDNWFVEFVVNTTKQLAVVRLEMSDGVAFIKTRNSDMTWTKVLPPPGENIDASSGTGSLNFEIVIDKDFKVNYGLSNRPDACCTLKDRVEYRTCLLTCTSAGPGRSHCIVNCGEEQPSCCGYRP